MQLLQDTTNAYSQLPDNQSVCALRTLEDTHWKFMPHFLSGQLIKRTHSALINFSLQQASLAIVPFWFFWGSRHGWGFLRRTQHPVLQTKICNLSPTEWIPLNPKRGQVYANEFQNCNPAISNLKEKNIIQDSRVLVLRWSDVGHKGKVMFCWLLIQGVTRRGQSGGRG